VTKRNIISVRRNPHGSLRQTKDKSRTNTGELKIIEVASPRGSRLNEKNSSTNVIPPTIPCKLKLILIEFTYGRRW